MIVDDYFADNRLLRIMEAFPNHWKTFLHNLKVVERLLHLECVKRREAYLRGDALK